jgi:hypothetical protein
VADESDMIVSDFTMPELEYLRQQCNFVNLEKDVFELRAQGIPLERIAEELNISVDYARKLSQRVNKKIIRIL